MTVKFRPYFLLTGGSGGALDAESVLDLNDLDTSIVSTDGIFYVYAFDATSTAAENSPYFIRPDDYVYAGVHVLQQISFKKVTTKTLDVNSKDTDATPIVTIQNTGGNIQQFLTNSNPEGVLTANIGDIAFVDETLGSLFIKEIGSGNTGWEKVSTKGYMLQVQTNALNPADLTTYYCGGLAVVGWIQTQEIQEITFPKAGTIKSIHFHFGIAGVVGTNEVSSLFIRINNTVDNLVDDAIDLSAPYIGANTGLSINVNAGDSFEFKWTTPAWVTNPLIVLFSAVIYVE